MKSRFRCTSRIALLAVLALGCGRAVGCASTAASDDERGAVYRIGYRGA